MARTSPVAENNYDQRNIDTMELVYGRGYLSAGGDEEVFRILEGINTTGGQVLDIGCGLGGAAVAIASRYDPAAVIGFDIDPIVLDRAERLVSESNLEEKISLVSGEPGPLPFPENRFDVVYVTAVSCHMKDLGGFFSDVLRLLKPGGWIAGSEWMRYDDKKSFEDFDNLLRQRGLKFYFVDENTFSAALEDAGFTQLELRDRTKAFTEYSRSGLERIKNKLANKLKTNLGENDYQQFLHWTETRYKGFAHGGLMQQHFRARKSH